MKVSENLKLIGISMLIFAGLAACSKTGTAETSVSKATVAAQQNRSPEKLPSIYRFLNSTSEYDVYVDVKNIAHLREGNMGDLIINYHNPVQLGPENQNKSYQSIEQLTSVSCSQNQFMITKTWYMSGQNLSGEFLGNTFEPSQIHSVSPGSINAVVRAALCLPEADLDNTL